MHAPTNKTLIKEIDRINMVKMALLPKTIYKLNARPITVLITSFADVEK
jgi:hypothetical protein